MKAGYMHICNSPVDALYPGAAQRTQGSDVLVLDPYELGDLPQNDRPQFRRYLEHRASFFEHLERLRGFVFKTIKKRDYLLTLGSGTFTD